MFNFYFDEAFHDQKITNIEGVLNSMTENALDNYIGVFLGLSEELLKDAEIVFLEFEQKYRKVFSIHKDNELKSRQIKIKRNYSAPKIPGIMQEFQQRQVLQLQRRLSHVFLLSRYKNGF